MKNDLNRKVEALMDFYGVSRLSAEAIVKKDLVPLKIPGYTLWCNRKQVVFSTMADGRGILDVMRDVCSEES